MFQLSISTLQSNPVFPLHQALSLLLCVAIQACAHVIFNTTAVFPFGFNSICGTNNFSITQIPHALQVAWLFTYMN